MESLGIGQSFYFPCLRQCSLLCPPPVVEWHQTRRFKFMNKHRYAVEWAQDFARWNRHLMMEQIVGAVRNSGEGRPFVAELKAINCHHNYVAPERHYGQHILVTRKVPVRAPEGDMAIIPGAMGSRPYIVRATGNIQLLTTCTHDPPLPIP